MKLSREGGLGTQPILGKALNTSQGEDEDLRLRVQPHGTDQGQTHRADMQQPQGVCLRVHGDTHSCTWLTLRSMGSCISPRTLYVCPWEGCHVLRSRRRLYCFLTDTKTTRELKSIITKRVLNSLSINMLLLSDCVTSINNGVIVSALNLDLFPSVFLN